MSDSPARKKSLRDLAEESSRQADEILEDELQTLLSVSRQDLEKLRPQITDEATYNELIGAVREANRRMESLDQFKKRLAKGGSKALKIGKIAAKLLTGISL